MLKNMIFRLFLIFAYLLYEYTIKMKDKAVKIRGKPYRITRILKNNPTAYIFKLIIQLICSRSGEIISERKLESKLRVKCRSP
jgi:hypothetical protein